MTTSSLYDIFNLKDLYIDIRLYYNNKNIDKSNILFFQELNNKELYSVSSVGTSNGNGNIIDDNIRKSKVADFNKTKNLRCYITTIPNYIEYDTENEDYLIDDEKIYIKTGNISKINKIDIKSIPTVNNSILYLKFNQLKVIKYEEGDHFDTFHYDTLPPDVIGTFLIFPPNNKNNPYSFEGGDIIFKGEDNQEIIVEPSKFTEWTVVLFGNVLHKCTKITKGIRWVFKTSIYSNIPIPNDNNTITLDKINSVYDELNSPINISYRLFSQECKIRNINEKINNLYDILAYDTKEFNNLKLEMINKGYFTYISNSVEDNQYSNVNNYRDDIDIFDKYNELNNKIEELNKDIKEAQSELALFIKKKEYISIYDIEDIFVKSPNKIENIYIYCLKNYYNDEDIYNLDKYSLEDIILIKNILDYNPKYKIIPYNCNVNKTIYCKTNCEDTRIKYNYSFQKYTWIEFNNFIYGKLKHKWSEYNDETGDDIYSTYDVSCLIIIT